MAPGVELKNLKYILALILVGFTNFMLFGICFKMDNLTRVWENSLQNLILRINYKVDHIMKFLSTLKYVCLSPFILSLCELDQFTVLKNCDETAKLT